MASSSDTQFAFNPATDRHWNIDKYKISWFVTGTEKYGVGSAILSLAGEMQRRGHECTILACGEGSLTELAHQAGISVTCLQTPPPPSFSGSPANVLTDLRNMRSYVGSHTEALRSAVANIEAHVLHIQWPNHVAFCGRATRHMSTACIWEMPHVLGKRHPFAMNKLLYQMVCFTHNVTVLANSEYTARSMGSYLVKPRVLYLGVDLERFSPLKYRSQVREKYDLPRDAIVLGMVSRLDQSKGHTLAIDALERLSRSGIDAFLVIVGGPTATPYAAELRKRASDYRLESRVRFLGETTKTEAFYDLFDLFLQISIVPEGFGLSAVEAMMMGVPVVTHALGGPAETVLDGITGWHFREPSVDGLEAALHRAMSCRSDWKKMGINAREHAASQFSISRRAQCYEALLSEITIEV